MDNKKVPKELAKNEIEWILTSELHFDPENPRLVEMGGAADEKEILKIYWREFAVDEIALSIAANGYFDHETLFIAEERNRFIVIEGNRRLAAVRLLLDADLREYVGATDLPTITAGAKKKLEKLPAIKSTRKAIWQYIGFKHVNGPQQWDSYPKAKYVAWVHNSLKVPLDKIARQIGDQHATVKRLYRAWMVLEQAEKGGVFDRNDRYRKHFAFSHLFTGLGRPGIQKYIGLSPGKSFDTKTPVPKSKLANLGELCKWLYGSKIDDTLPLIKTQNPDLKILDEVLLSKDATAALRRGLPLEVARDIGKGDERLFREGLIKAKQSLQEVRGKLLTGYKGEPDLLKIAADIMELAINILKDMEELKVSKKAKPGS